MAAAPLPDVAMAGTDRDNRVMGVAIAPLLLVVDPELDPELLEPLLVV